MFVLFVVVFFVFLFVFGFCLGFFFFLGGGGMEVLGGNGSEWTGKVEISPRKKSDSRQGMHGYILTCPTFYRENLSSLGSQQRGL